MKKEVFKQIKREKLGTSVNLKHARNTILQNWLSEKKHLNQLQNYSEQIVWLCPFYVLSSLVMSGSRTCWAFWLKQFVAGLVQIYHR